MQLRHIKEDTTIKVLGSVDYVGYIYYLLVYEKFTEIRINSKIHGIVHAIAEKSLTKKISNHLHECVRIEGTGIWSKDKSGWCVSDVHVKNIVPLKDENLLETVQHIKSMEIYWPDYPISRLVDQ